MLVNRAKRGKKHTENTSYWMSYSDMMSALLLMFVLLLFLAFTRYTALQETKEAELAAKEVQIAATEEQQQLTQNELTKRESELAAIRSALNSSQLRVDEQELELAQKTAAHNADKEELEQSLAQLILQQKMIEEQEALLALSQEEIDAARAQLEATAQDLSEREIALGAKDMELLLEKLRVADLQTLLDTQKDQLDEQAVRIEELVGVRPRIIEQLRDAFAEVGLTVAVDNNTGAIRMDSTVFFDTDRAVLKEDGRALLMQILPVYFRTLTNAENAQYVAEIIIEGHTDSDGTYAHNLDLSQRRAAAVVNFCMDSQFPGLSQAEQAQVRQMITASGRSESQLIYDAYGVEDKAASRRVEIKFRLKDAELIDGLNRILSSIGE